MSVDKHHERYFNMLLNQAQSVRYPSHRILERIERTATSREMAMGYVSMLLDIAGRQRYPSLQMIDRAGRMVEQWRLREFAEKYEMALQEGQSNGHAQSGG